MADFEAFSSPTVSDSLSACGVCGRTFMPESLRKHEPICKKSNKPRKVFQSGRQRAQGTDVPISKVLKSGAPPPSKSPSKSSAVGGNWRQKHEDFVNTIRAARGVSKALATGGPLPPPPPPTINPDYVQCNTCGRRFNQTAAERHIQFCAEKNRRLPDKKIITDQAQRREAARKNYKAARPVLKTGHDTGYNDGMPVRGMGRTGSTGSTLSSRSARSQGRNEEYESPALRTGRTEENYYAGRNMRSGSFEGAQNDRMMKSTSSRHNGYTEKAKRSTAVTTGRRSPASSYYDAGHYAPSPPNGRPPSGNYSHKTREMSGDGNNRGKSASRFCHDCGNKFCRNDARYCCECGTKRLYVH